MFTSEKAGQKPGLPLAAKSGNQFDELELEFDEEFELEFDEEFELELDEEFEEEFELLFEDEFELEFELLLDEEFELLLELEFELPLDEEFELDSPRRFWPFRSFFIFKAVVTNLVSPALAAVSIAVPVLTAPKAGMMNDPAATAVAASKVVSFLI